MDIVRDTMMKNQNMDVLPPELQNRPRKRIPHAYFKESSKEISFRGKAVNQLRYRMSMDESPVQPRRQLRVGTPYQLGDHHSWTNHPEDLVHPYRKVKRRIVRVSGQPEEQKSKEKTSRINHWSTFNLVSPSNGDCLPKKTYRISQRTIDNQKSFKNLFGALLDVHGYCEGESMEHHKSDSPVAEMSRKNNFRMQKYWRATENKNSAKLLYSDDQFDEFLAESNILLNNSRGWKNKCSSNLFYSEDADDLMRKESPRRRNHSPESFITGHPKSTTSLHHANHRNYYHRAMTANSWADNRSFEPCSLNDYKASTYRPF